MPKPRYAQISLEATPLLSLFFTLRTSSLSVWPGWTHTCYFPDYNRTKGYIMACLTS